MPQHPTRELNSLFALRYLLTALALSVTYLLISWMLIGFHADQLTLVVLFNSCYFYSAASRRFITGFSIFIVFWILFDYMKVLPNYRFQTVHIQDLYEAEKKLFGFVANGKMLTPNEYWRLNGQPTLDILSGFFYLCWIPLPLTFAAYLFVKKRNIFLPFSLTFLLVNLIGFVGYYWYPAAPPWYVHQYGFVFEAGTPGNTAGLEKFDQFFGMGIFKSLYAKSSNVFAAMPSLHSAYPLVVLYFGVKHRLGKVNLFFGLITAGIWFAAVYSNHHYILDVLAGVLCALAGIFLFQWLYRRNTWVKKWISGFDHAIA